MKRFSLNASFDADCVITDASRVGEIYHVARNSAGGAILTPIALYFVWRPEFVENFNPYWRVDCFVRKHKLAPRPMVLGEDLVSSLTKEKLCEEPIWLSVHESVELNGKEYGNIFDEED